MARPRILVTRPDHLGDVLLTLGAAAALRRTFPAARVGYAVAPRMAEVVSRCPSVDEVHPVPFPPPNAASDPPAWTRAVAGEAGALRGRYDIALVMRPDDPWSGALVAAAAIPVRLGYDQPRTRPWLTRALSEPPGRHAVLLALDLAAAASDSLGVELVSGCDPFTGGFVPSEGEAAEAARVLDETGVTTSPFILHPGSGWKLKNWPARRWGRLAAELATAYGTTPLVIGGPGEDPLVEAVVAASGGSAVGVRRCLTVGELAALHGHARLVVGTDSGLLHLAAMMGAPVVGLYGPADPLVFAPWAPPDRRRVVRVPLPCSPCGTLEHPPCGAVEEPYCVMRLDTGTIFAAAAELLQVSS